MSKPIIAVDIDEVIFPLVPDLVKYVDLEHKVRLSAEEFVTYKLEDIWPKGPEEGKLVYQQYEKADQIEVAPLEGAQQALGKLALKYDLIIITYRSIEIEPKTKRWLERHFKDLFKDVHMLGGELGVQARSKGEVCKELGISCLIDDQVPNVVSAHQAGIQALLFGDYVWNQSHDLPKGITRAKNWLEVLDILL